MWYSHNSADLRLRVAYPFVDRFVTVSRDSFPMSLEKCRVVGHGIDTDLFRPVNRADDGQGEGQSKDRPVRFLSLGRVSPRKDQETLVSAADVLVNRLGHRNVEFVIAGGPLVPDDRAYYQRQWERVRDLGLESFFQFTGSIPHLETVHHVQNCDFFVNMHVEGGLGKAVLEAMSCGKPAFVSTPTYYDPFPEYARDFLFAPRDPEDLARKMMLRP